MNIRQYVEFDFDEVYRLNYNVSPDEDKEYFKKDISDGKTTLYVYEVNEEIVGVISFSFPFYNLCARINLVSVKQNFQGQQIGTKLINFAIIKLREERLRFITIDTALWDFRTIKLYQKLGFKAVNVFSEYYGDNNDMVWLEMDLRNKK